MDDTSVRTLAICFLLGLIGIAVGGYQCINGHNYSAAAQHEATTVGRITKISSGKGGSIAYHYVFTVNGVRVDDYSEICATPLAPGACDNLGPVLVYYSFQPFRNSRLEDFAVASNHAYHIGIPALVIGLPLFFLSSMALVNLARKEKSEGDPDSENQEG